MEKLPMCRICLAENVRMYLVVNRNLHELYEKLTDNPFVTEDRRPILACFICCAKLKQCYRLLRKCLEAEELFAQMVNKDYEPNPLINQDHLDSFNGFTKCPIVFLSIVDECQTENIAIKKELPAVFERLDEIIEPMEEQQNEELELENVDNSCLDVADIIPPQHSELNFKDDVPLMEFKTEVEEEQAVSKMRRRATETKRATVTRKPKLDTRRTKLEDGDAITAEQTIKDKLDSTFIRATRKRTSKPDTYFQESYKYDQRSFNREIKNIHPTRTQFDEKPCKWDLCQRGFNHKGDLIKHIGIHTGEKLYKCDSCQHSFRKMNALTKHIRIHTGEKPFKCDVCQRSYSEKGNLITHIRVHTGEKPYKCDVCQRSFSVKCSLLQHIRVHTGEKPYKCDVCQRSFSLRVHLLKHILIHTGEKPFKCDVCQRSFSQKANLTKHILIHTGEKPYKCEVCQHVFRVKAHLLRHIRIHTGEKRYKCNICPSSFSEKGTLTKHVRIHTGE